MLWKKNGNEIIIFPLLNRVNGNWLTANSFKYSNLKTNRIVYYNENFSFLFFFF